MFGFNSRRLALVLGVFLACLSIPALHAEEAMLPDFVRANLRLSLNQIGSGTYRKLGFSVYRASLWTANETWSPRKPYALRLQYTRSVSQETLADTVVDDIRGQNVTDEETFKRWEKTLRDVLPAVEDGDVMVGVALPGKKSYLFFNGKEIARIDDLALSQAFFNIWLGDGADPDLKRKLLGG
ncbi:MAG: chalcone isomerase family protein [Alphaproteobacteria bacterium]|nr:chalcone isomerase family protein [Alphaproteobacteria bacterium]